MVGSGYARAGVTRLIPMLVMWALACTPFGVTTAQPASDAGSDGTTVDATPIARDVRVEVDWPSVAALDPRADTRLRKIHVTVTDALAPERTAAVDLDPAQAGPYVFPQLSTGDLVDAVVELRTDADRVIGYGHRRRWSLAASTPTVRVAVRKRLVYLGLEANSAALRFLDAAPLPSEPSLEELTQPALAGLSTSTALYSTSDGELLVQAGSDANGRAVVAFRTGSHTQDQRLNLPITPAAMTPLLDGYTAVASPSAADQLSSLTLVDLRARTATSIPTGIQGGFFDTKGAATSADGERAAVVIRHVDGGADKPLLLVVDARTRAVTRVPLEASMAQVGAVRFSLDGKRLVVLGYKQAALWSTGVLAVFDPANLGKAPTLFMMAAGVTRPKTLVLSPSGKSALVGNETQYTSPICCNETRAIDLDTGAETWKSGASAQYPDVEVAAAVRFPVPPFRVLGGQTDNGNNKHGPIVEILGPDQAPIEANVDASSNIGGIHSLAALFGDTL